VSAAAARRDHVTSRCPRPKRLCRSLQMVATTPRRSLASSLQHHLVVMVMYVTCHFVLSTELFHSAAFHCFDAYSASYPRWEWIVLPVWGCFSWAQFLTKKPLVCKLRCKLRVRFKTVMHGIEVNWYRTLYNCAWKCVHELCFLRTQITTNQRVGRLCRSGVCVCVCV